MSFVFDAPEVDDFESGGLWLSEPGTYHCSVSEVNESPTNKDGEPLDGFKVKLTALAGTVADQKERTVNLLFFNPNMSSKDGGKFARRKQAKFLYATGLLNENQLGQRVEIDLQHALGRQVIATLEKDGNFLQLSYDNIYHVDDPQASKFPKDEAALRLIPKELRRDPSSFKSTRKPDSKPAAAVNLDDL